MENKIRWCLVLAVVLLVVPALARGDSDVESLIAEGYRHLEAGQPKKAIKKLEVADQRSEGGSAEALVMLSAAYLALEDLEAAEKAAHGAIALEPPASLAAQAYTISGMLNTARFGARPSN